MRFLVRVLSSSVDHQEFLGVVRSLARAVGIEVRNPKWTSYGSLELDAFAPSIHDFLLFLAAVEPLGAIEFWRDLSLPPKFMEKAELIAEARALFNAERYWECHEVLEALWRTLAGEEKLFVQGIILVCAAYVHHQKSEDTVAAGVLKRASAQLGWRGKSYLGIDVESLRRDVGSALDSRTFPTFRI